MEGDTLKVTRLDRVARSPRDLSNTPAAIAAKRANFRPFGDIRADATTSRGRLMLTVLGGRADEFERDLVRTRTGDGRERAKLQGVKMGRKLKGTPHRKHGALHRNKNGGVVRETARSYNVHNSTVSRLAV